MGDHLIDGEFQSDKYPSTPRGCVPLKPSDKTAQDLLWEYAQRRRSVDPGFADDLEEALRLKGYVPPYELETLDESVKLSNKACRHQYVALSGSAGGAGGCTCPAGRCWYSEQVVRRQDGLKAIAPRSWDSSFADVREGSEK